MRGSWCRWSVAASMPGKPATALLICTPRRASGSPSVVSPAPRTASRAATTAYCENRSERRRRLRSKWSSGTKFLTSAAMRVGRSRASKREISATPDLPASSACQLVSLSLPTGVRAPMPVTTTAVSGLSGLSGLWGTVLLSVGGFRGIGRRGAAGAATGQVPSRWAARNASAVARTALIPSASRAPPTVSCGMPAARSAGSSARSPARWRRRRSRRGSGVCST